MRWTLPVYGKYRYPLALGQGCLHCELIGRIRRLLILCAVIVDGRRRGRIRQPMLRFRIARETLHTLRSAHHDRAGAGFCVSMRLPVRILERGSYKLRSLRREHLLPAVHAQTELARVDDKAFALRGMVWPGVEGVSTPCG
jgi:hypothetical protein